MPRYVAANFAESLLFTLSACEREGVRYAAHFGTLLGAHRLGGVCPWDEDADIYVLDEDRGSLEGKLRTVLESHGFDLVWDERGFFWVRQRPWWAGQGHIALEFFADAPRDAGALSAEDPWISPEQLWPLRRYPFHGSWLWGPAEADAILARLYGENGTPAAMARFQTPRLPAETEAFWHAARADGLDWDAVSRRALERLRRRPWGHLATFPWWWFNGAYNVAVQRLRRVGRTLVLPSSRL